jgi:hypothetical protein
LATLGGLAVVGALALLHVWSASLAGLVADRDARPFDLGAAGSVGDWLAAMLSAVAGLIAMFIYSLRRHRVDDYHGRYRLWMWTAIACLAVSLGEATSIGAAVEGPCRRAAAWSGMSETLVWPAVVGTLLAIAAMRLLVEIRQCRAAIVLLAACGLGFAVAAATSHDWWIQVSEANRRLVARGSWLAGYVALLTLFLTYARFVALQIEGKIAVVPNKPKRRKAKAPSAPAAQESRVESTRKCAPSVRTDLDSNSWRAATPPPKATSIASAPATASAAVGSSPSANSQNHRPLSRAERRRLRREARAQS